MYFKVLLHPDEYQALLDVVLLGRIVSMIKRWFKYTVVNESQYAERGTLDIVTVYCEQVTFLEFVFAI